MSNCKVASGPHALTSIVSSGYYPPDNQKIAYNAFQKAIEISEGPYRMTIDYGPGQERIRTQWYSDNNLEKTKYYAANYEKELIQQKNGTTTREICYISSPYGTIAAHIKENGAGQIYYLHTDHLGSITAITRQNGVMAEERSFDAWGRPRNSGDWSYTNVSAMSILDRGYTFHEHLPQFGLINMNGRMYDPIVARFLSVDPYKPVDMGGSQAFNGYSYCLNNPLKYTDPSGENPLAMAAIAGVLMGALTGGATADMQGANVWKGMAIGGFVGGLGGLAGYGLSVAGTAMGVSGIMPGMAYGLVSGTIVGGFSGGLTAALSGTDFWKGVGTGAFTGAITGSIFGAIQGGVQAKRMGLNSWTGKRNIITEFVTGEALPGDLLDAVKNASNYAASQGAKWDTKLLQARMKDVFNISEGDFGIKSITTTARKYGMNASGEYVNLKSGKIVGGFYNANLRSIHISPAYATKDLFNFKLVAGHELIHAINHYSLGSAYLGFISERVAYSYSSTIFNNVGRYIDAASNNTTQFLNLFIGNYPGAYQIPSITPYNFLYFPR